MLKTRHTNVSPEFDPQYPHKKLAVIVDSVHLSFQSRGGRERKITGWTVTPIWYVKFQDSERVHLKKKNQGDST